MDTIDTLLSEAELNLTLETKYTKETAAHYCCKNGHASILARILQKSDEAKDKIDDEGNTLMHSLCYVSLHKFIFKLMIKNN